MGKCTLMRTSHQKLKWKECKKQQLSKQMKFDGFWYMRMQRIFCSGLLVGSVWKDTSWNNRRASLPCAPTLPYPFSSCSHCSHCCVWLHHIVLEFSLSPYRKAPLYSQFPSQVSHYAWMFSVWAQQLCSWVACQFFFWTWPEHAHFLTSALL